jgi:cell wall-associated NlpC family hydrolase
MPVPQALYGALPAAMVATAMALALASTPARAADPDPAEQDPSRNLFSSWLAGASKPSEAPGASAPKDPRARATELVDDALGLMGIRYRFGGNTPSSGFDCSGMVRYVFQNTLGLDLPRRAEEISRVGVKVDRDELKPGDLVFYKTLRRAFSHVGIYLGNNRFIHAPSAGGAVRVEDMNERYWVTRFNGARRVDE